MNVKANYNGCCLYCGKESKNPFCNRECYRSYVRDGLSPDPKQAERDRSKQLRDALTDAMVRKAIYRASQGTIKYNQITTEMIIEKRAHILEWRKRQEELKANQEPRKKRDPHCAICGKEISGRLKYCSDECRKQKGRDYYYANHQHSLEIAKIKYISKWQPPAPFACQECGKLHQPAYGDTRTSFCSDRCSRKHTRREHKKRAEENGVFYEYVNPRKVFERDGWRCQLCKKKLNPKHRGTIRDDAPELDHIIPWAQSGEHSYRNTQCTCRKCNEAKGAALQGQLRMFG
ncbi:MAG: HNH endonuclease signature motif containing protein [Bacteroidales bacterium]|jgi:hypothetical protein